MKARFRLWSIYLCLCVLGTFAIIAGLPRLGASAASRPKDHVANNNCQWGWVYNDISVLAYPFMQFGPTYQNYNGTDHDENDTFATWTQGRVEVRTERAFIVDFNAILSGVHRETRKEVEREIEVNVGNSVSAVVPPHKSVYARFGVYEINARGHYYLQDQFCHDLVDGGSLTSWCPWYSGWNTWIIDPDWHEDPKK